jgi:hypothetical protein
MEPDWIGKAPENAESISDEYDFDDYLYNIAKDK